MTSELEPCRDEIACQKATLLSVSAIDVCDRLRRFQCRSARTTMPAEVNWSISEATTSAYDWPFGRHEPPR